MIDPSASLLNLAVKKGMIPAKKAEDILATVQTVSSPIEWLIENEHITIDQAEDLRAGAMGLLRDENLSGEAARTTPNPGQKFGPYELLKKIGEGGMGMVYSARDPRLDRVVAIKILHRAENPTILSRFQREARVMAKLTHPRIVNIFDVGEESGRPYLVMEMHKGISLAQALHENKLSRKHALEVIRQAAVGVSFANKNGVFHRDIKPGNILVTPRGEGIVMDFGLAKLSEGQEQTLSVEGSLLGTPAYMSPEQATGNLEKIDPRTDVWGLGATLYHVLSGKPPFSEKSVHEVLKAIIEKDPAVLPGLPPDLETICSKAMEKNPRDRYQSATDFARDLRFYLSGEPILATPPRTIHLIRRWGFRKRRLLIAGACGLFMAVFGTILLTEMTQSNRFDRLKAETITEHTQGNWARVIANAEQALRIQEDAELETLRAQAQHKLNLKKTLQDEQAKKISKQITLENLRKIIRPLEDKIRETRVHFYAKGVDIRTKIISVEKSIQELETLLREKEPYRELALGWKTIGLGWFFVGDPVRAESALLTAGEISPEDSEVTQHLGRIYLQRSLEALKTKEVASPEEKKALAEKWAIKATRLLEKGESGHNRDEEFETLLAKVYLARSRGNREEVIRICGKALSRYSDRLGAEEFIFFQGSVEIGKKALDKFTEVIERAPNHARAFYERGMYHAREGNHREAKRDLDQSIRINPRSVWSYISRGIILVRLGNNREALKDYYRGLEYLVLQEPIYEIMNRPRYSQILAGRIHREMASLYMEENNHDKAKTCLDNAIRMNDQDSLSYRRRGNLFRRKQEWRLAKKDYEKALSLAETSGKPIENILNIIRELEMKAQSR